MVKDLDVEDYNCWRLGGVMVKDSLRCGGVWGKEVRDIRLKRNKGEEKEKLC
jgi:hypothetical protein